MRPDSRLARLIAEVAARNPHCGEFFMALADSLDLLRRYPAAAEYYREAQSPHAAAAVRPRPAGPDRDAAGTRKPRRRKLLEESFRADPFHVRVKNMLEVLDVLQGYATLETEHFVIRFDRGRDELLARYAARYLEDEVYPQVVRQAGLRAAGEVAVRDLQPGPQLQRPCLVQRPHGRAAVHRHGGRLCRADGRHGLAQRHAPEVQLGPGPAARVRARRQSAADRLQHPALVHRGAGRAAGGPAAAGGLERDAGPPGKAGTLFDLDTINLAFIRPKDPERLDPGLLPGGAVCRVHAASSTATSPWPSCWRPTPRI